MKSMKVKLSGGAIFPQHPDAELGWVNRSCVTLLVDNIPDGETAADTVRVLMDTAFMVHDGFWAHIDYTIDRKLCGRGVVYPRLRIADTSEIAEMLGLSSIHAASNLCRSGRLSSARKSPRGWTALVEDVEMYRDEEMTQGRRHPTTKQSEARNADKGCQ